MVEILMMNYVKTVKLMYDIAVTSFKMTKINLTMTSCCDS